MLRVAKVAGKLFETTQLEIADVLPIALREQVHEHPEIPDPVDDDAALCVPVEPLFPDVPTEVTALADVQLRRRFA